MRNSSCTQTVFWAMTMALMAAPTARAEAEPTRGFLVERFQAAPAGAGWLTQDDLALSGGLGGAAALTAGYAHDPLVVPGSAPLAVVSDQAHVNIGMALTYDRYRLSLDLASPVAMRGDSGTLAGLRYTAPRVDIASHPDTVSDVRLGVDARLYGHSSGPLRLGVGAHLFVPSGQSSDYVTDDTFRALLRVLAAGDTARFAYAAQLGFHVRPLDDPQGGIGPRGNEFTFGMAGGVRMTLTSPATTVIVGPEVFGATAPGSFLGTQSSALEALLGARLEHRGDSGRLLRVKLGAGAGLGASFGAPAWRAVLAVEVLGQATAGPEAQP